MANNIFELSKGVSFNGTPAKRVYFNDILVYNEDLYTITFLVDSSSSISITGHNGRCSFPSDPIKQNYRFRGWYDNEKGNGGTFTSLSKFDKDTTLYAVFESTGGGVGTGDSRKEVDAEDPTKWKYTIDTTYTYWASNGSLLYDGVEITASNTVPNMKYLSLDTRDSLNFKAIHEHAPITKILIRFGGNNPADINVGAMQRVTLVSDPEGIYYSDDEQAWVWEDTEERNITEITITPQNREITNITELYIWTKNSESGDIQSLNLFSE